jgi:ribosomal protein L32E
MKSQSVDMSEQLATIAKQMIVSKLVRMRSTESHWRRCHVNQSKLRLSYTTSSFG